MENLVFLRGEEHTLLLLQVLLVLVLVLVLLRAGATAAPGQCGPNAMLQHRPRKLARQSNIC